MYGWLCVSLNVFVNTPQYSYTEEIPDVGQSLKEYIYKRK